MIKLLLMAILFMFNSVLFAETTEATKVIKTPVKIKFQVVLEQFHKRAFYLCDYFANANRIRADMNFDTSIDKELKETMRNKTYKSINSQIFGSNSDEHCSWLFRRQSTETV